MSLRLLPLAMMLLLSACAGGEFRPVSDAAVKIGAPYRVRGVTYTPAADPGYDMLGLASWYGSESGKRTANGERFRPRGVSAAHTTLPLPSYVEVTALDTGRRILVRVNDRGPFAGRGRILDLWRGAAHRGQRAVGPTKVVNARDVPRHAGSARQQQPAMLRTQRRHRLPQRAISDDDLALHPACHRRWSGGRCPDAACRAVQFRDVARAHVGRIDCAVLAGSANPSFPHRNACAVVIAPNLKRGAQIGRQRNATAIGEPYAAHLAGSRRKIGLGSG